MWKKLELEWKIIIIAVLVIIALALPVQKMLVSRLETTLEMSIDPQLENLLRSQVDSTDAAANQGIIASLERGRQWQAMIPIIVREQQAAIIVLSILAFITLIIAAIWALRRLTRPLKELGTAAEAIGHGQRAVIHQDAGGSLGRLQRSMDSMQQELELLRARAEAKGMEEAWRDIARVMAHEIKNPLTPMRLTLDRIQEKQAAGAQLNETELSGSLERIQAQVENLERLVNAFRSFAREPEMHLKPLDITGPLEAVARDLEKTIKTSITGTARIIGDRHLLDQVFLNIWKNAAEAGADTITVTVVPGDLQARVTISDNGPGIGKERTEKVWIPYITFKKGGTGLGLPVVKRLIETMGGSVELASRTAPPDTGVTITLLLPLHKEEGP